MFGSAKPSPAKLVEKKLYAPELVLFEYFPHCTNEHRVGDEYKRNERR